MRWPLIFTGAEDEDAEALDLYRRIVSRNRELEQLRDALEQAYADLRDRFENRGDDCV